MFRRRTPAEPPAAHPDRPTPGTGSGTGRRTGGGETAGGGTAGGGTAGAGTASAGPTGKGRPTPTRREAEAARKQRVRPRLDRRAAARARREQARAERLRVRKAMAQGDERHYLSRDRGPLRRFVRDYVDSRRTAAEFFLPVILIVLLLSFVPVAQVQLLSTILWLTAMVLVVIDLFWLNVRLRRELRRRFPEDSGGHVLYGLARATQLRRLRLPKPAVRPGDRI